MSLALEGIRVIDVSQVAAVPMCARHLADFGADVIHVENPAAGDSWRTYQAGAGGGTAGVPSEVNYNFETFNRNKRSMSLDLSTGAGRAVIHRLLGGADVFVTNLRPFERERFALEWDTLHRLNPRLIYASVSGYGKKGPDRDLPAYDATALWFRSGINYALSQKAQPGLGFRPAFGDTVAALALFSGVMTALYVREREGVGQEIDLSLYNVGVYQLSFDMSAALVTGTDFKDEFERRLEEMKDDPRLAERDRLMADAEAAVARLRDFMMENANPLCIPYRTRDERVFHINILQPERYWPRVCRAIGREALIEDERFSSQERRAENNAELYHTLRDAFLGRTLDEWRPRLNREGVPWAPQQTIMETVNDPQARANDFFVPFDHPTHGRIEVVANPIRMSETPATMRLPAPEFGQHTEEILLEAGYTWEDVARLKEQGAIA